MEKIFRKELKVDDAAADRSVADEPDDYILELGPKKGETIWSMSQWVCVCVGWGANCKTETQNNHEVKAGIKDPQSTRLLKKCLKKESKSSTNTKELK